MIEITLGKLELIEVFSVNVPEPSGLSFGPNNLTLLTVSDHTNMVYEMDLQGNVIRTLNHVGLDLEGVTYNPDEGIVAVAEEADREISFIDYDSGETLQTYKLEIPSNSADWRAFHIIPIMACTTL